MKVLLVFGTRPEAIKMCPIIKELEKQDDVEYKVCLTGQHKEMITPIMQIFHVSEDYNLGIMKSNQTLTSITSDILIKMDRILEDEKPDLVLVHGDTTSAFVAAMASFYRKISVGHVEAGLRTYNMNSPYPEEFNRQAIDLITSYYFAPTEWAKENLIKEGKENSRIFLTGNTAIDALNFTVKESFLDENLEWALGSKLILVTVHRRENIGQPMYNIFSAINKLVEDNPDVKVIYPIHKNPAVREIAKEVFDHEERIRLIEPLDVIEFHNYMKRAYLIMTDSGGIQEEAPALGKPVLVLRDTTERPEGIEAGTAKLLGTDKNVIYQETRKLLTDSNEYQKMSSVSNPYGDGLAAKRIVDIIMSLNVDKNSIWFESKR